MFKEMIVALDFLSVALAFILIQFGGYPIFETGMFSLGFIFASIIFLFAIEDNTGVEI